MAVCEGLALVTFARKGKLARLSRGASKGCDTWYQSRVPIFELAL